MTHRHLVVMQSINWEKFDSTLWGLNPFSVLCRYFTLSVMFRFVAILHLKELKWVLCQTFFFFLQLLLLTSLTSLILRELEYHDFMRLRKIIQKIWNHLLSSQIRCSDLQTGKVKSFCWHSGGNFNQLPRTRGWSWWHWSESGAIACTSEHYLGQEQLCIPLRHFACWRRGERGGLRDWLYSSVGSHWRPLEPPCRGKRNALPPFPPRRSPAATFSGPCRDGGRWGIPSWEQSCAVTAWKRIKRSWVGQGDRGHIVESMGYLPCLWSTWRWLRGNHSILDKGQERVILQ